MFNPFLSEVEQHTVPQYGNGAGDAAVASNPFLSGELFSFQQQPQPTQNENPFLASMTSVSAAYGAGNPFADFVAPQTSVGVGFIGATETGVNSWNEMQTSYGSVSELEQLQPMSTATQDLLSTVTGALEATSDSLLDRLRYAQPSPVPQPPSPTPSPRSPSPDLLMGDEDLTSSHHHPFVNSNFPPKTIESTTTIDLMGLYGKPPEQPKTHSQPFGDVQLVSDFQPQQSPFFQQIQQQQAQPPTKTDALGDIFDLNIDAAPPQPTYEPPKPTTEPPKPITSPPKPTAEPPKHISSPPKPTPEPPIQFEMKPEIVQVSKPIELEPQKPAEVKMPEKLPPSRPTQPPKPSPSRPPPPVPPSPRRDPPTPVPAASPKQQTPPAADSMSIFEPPKPEAQAEQIAPMTTNYDSSPFFAPQTTFDPSSPFSAPTPPHVPPAPCPSPSPFAQNQTSSPFSVDALTAAVEMPKGRGPPPVPPAPRVYPPTPSPQPPPPPAAFQQATIQPPQQKVDFDSFEDRFNSVTDADGSAGGQDAFGAFDGSAPTVASAWGDEVTKSDGFGDSSGGFGDSSGGFGDSSGGFGEDKFDEFLSLREPPPVPQSTPAKSRMNSGSDDFDKPEPSLSITIRQKEKNDFNLDLVPSLAPPPKSPAISTGSAYSEDNNSSFVPFLSSVKVAPGEGGGGAVPRSDSQDSPQTPLFEEDQSQPLEDFPRIKFSGDGWEMQMRHPNKKKITGQRFWKKVYVRLVPVNDIPTVQIFNTAKDKDPIQEIPLQPCYSVSDIAAQQFDQFGKIFTAKLQYVFYKERPGVRPGQITKAERITTKLSQFAAYAIQGDYQGVKEFGSDLKKLGLPLEHAPQVSQLVKLGTQNYEEMKQFSMVIEEALFRLPVHRDRALTYKSEEVQVTLVDEFYAEQDAHGVVTKQIARVRLYFLSFLSGQAEVELGINDIRRQGKEVVGRHDIIPIATEEWIRTEDIEFSSCVQLDVFNETKMVKFKPLDACYIELLRFRVRPPRHRELPLQVKTVFTTTGHRIEIRCDILVPGFTSRKLGQIPCEDVMIRIPIPECWIYMFRVEKHFRYGSVKSAHRRSGKVKGIERFLGAVEAVENSLMEVTSGQAKYEHQHKAIVWRVARLPKEGQGAYTTHSFFCHITLQPHEEIPANLTKYCYVEFTMPHTTISHTVCRSVSVPMCDEPPEKFVKYLSRHEYVVEVEHTQGVTPATYNLAATVVKEEVKPPPEEPMEGKAQSDSDFSDD